LRIVTPFRIAGVSVIMLLVLDVGRSINARIGYANAAETWQPDQRVYSDLAWPPGSSMSAEVPLGERVYAQRCAVCHGPDGRGNGPAAPSMIPRPRDFTLGLYKYKSTPFGEPPTDGDLQRVVADGLPASAMPYFRDLLKEEEIRAVVARVKRFSRVFSAVEPHSIHIPPRLPASQASLARGRALYISQGCLGCHGPDGRKGGYLQDAKNYPVLVRDLSAPWTFRGGAGAEHVWLRLTTGLPGSSMPSYAYALTPAERWDVASYVDGLARVPPWEPGGLLAGAGQQPDLLRRGEYLVHAEMCGLCHTPINRTGIYRGDDRYLAGGMRVVAYPHGVFVSRNLTSDADTGLGRWTEAQTINALRNGRTPTRLLTLWAMPWFYLHYLTDADATAVARYLKTLPPVRNRIPAPLHYGVVETIVSKLTRRLPAANVTVLTYADGNFGRAESQSLPERLQLAFTDSQWAVLVVGTAAFLLTVRRSERRGRRRTAWLIIPCITGGASFGALVWALYALPTLAVIPADQIVAQATAGIPASGTLGPGTLERQALLDRGRYLYTVASCAFCHNPNGAGGQKISWRPFGTLWSRNITSDKRTGIGGWSDSQVARAVRSGITPDGRTLHWQGMTWDHASNWDEEDLRALVAYLRVLPAVDHRIPPARPPAADDCAVYTFWIATSTVPGCQ
jgi:mono/diheme cytochrome c family protein